MSNADWISPQVNAAGILSNLPAATGVKVSLLDSDHWFVRELYGQPLFGRHWVWKAFTSGHQPLLMEHLPPLSFVDRDYPLSLDDTGYVASRRAMGHTRKFAQRVDLARATPQPHLSSTGNCLAAAPREYVVYQPRPREAFHVELVAGKYDFEWFDPSAQRLRGSGQIAVDGGRVKFKAPFEGDAVLWLRATGQ